jgi:periplasmic copper chaperone A
VSIAINLSSKDSLMKYRLLSAMLLTLCAAPAMGHVTANPDTGKSGDYFQTSIRIAHGCNGSNTTEIRVKIPEGILSVRPQNKPGWTIEMVKRTLEQPIVSPHGLPITEVIDEIIWRDAVLPADHYDDFEIIMKLPDMAGQTLWFATIQQCTKGENRWVEIPSSGKEWHDLKRPAPFVKLMPSQG